MISAREAHLRTTRKLSPQALEQLQEIEGLIIKKMDWQDPDDMRFWIYYDKPILAEVRVMLCKLGYKFETSSLFIHEPRENHYCISWRDAIPYVYRGKKIE